GDINLYQNHDLYKLFKSVINNTELLELLFISININQKIKDATLNYCVYNNLTDSVFLAVKYGANVNNMNDLELEGHNPIHIVNIIIHQHVENKVTIAKFLLDNGASVNSLND